MICEKCHDEIIEDKVFYTIEVVKKYANNPDIGYPEKELLLCEECGELAMFDL